MMPAYYHHPGPRDYSLTPPEYSQNYNAGGCGGQYQTRSWTDQPGMGAVDHSRYAQHSHMGPSSTMMYQLPSYAQSNPGLASGVRYYDPMRASVLPPMHHQDRHSLSMGQAPTNHSQRNHLSRPAAQAKDEKSVGGVSPTLDYDLDHMTDYVVEMTQAIILPSRTAPASSEFRQWIHSMLSATRLPSTTIAMAMHYLTLRMHWLSQPAQIHRPREHLHLMITIALTLGSKFLDDNTFINKSWSDVSGIAIPKLNMEELDWLVSMNWILHRDPNEEHGFYAWLRQWKEFEAQTIDRAQQMSRNKLAPIDTGMNRQPSMHSVRNGFSPPQQLYSRPSSDEIVPTPAQGQFTPAFSTYGPWASARASADNSPASAPHTGPTTPEFYYGGNMWNHPEGYSRRTMFGVQPMQLVPQQQSFGQEQYQHYAAAWNAHGSSCACILCNHQHPPSYTIHGPAFAPQSVMA